MSALFEVPPTHPLKTCHRCAAEYDPDYAEWCGCDRLARSLVCPGCLECFCDAPVAYRRSYWSTVPAAVRQDARRFAADRTTFPTVQAARETAPTAPIVVIIDDDEALRSLVACYVDSLGYRTLVTGDAGEALAFAEHPEVRVVITDAFMPRMDGRELCRTLKRKPGGEQKKVIVITSLYTARRFRSEAFREFGVDEYLCKPLDLPALGSLLRTFAPLPDRFLKTDACPDSEHNEFTPRVA